MRVSELAKELGYKAAELVELAKSKGLKVEDARANLDARLAAAVRAGVPHRAKLSGTLLEVYQKAVTDEAARAAVKAAEPKPEKKVKEPPPEGAEPKPKRAPPKKKEEEPAPVAVTGKPVVPVKPGKKTKVVEEFRLGEGKATPGVKPVAHHKPIELSAEEQAEIKAESAKPLIDVDKVIGAQKEVHVARPIEIEVFTRESGIQEPKEKRHIKTLTKASQGTPILRTPVPVPPPPPPPQMRPSAPMYRPGGQSPSRTYYRPPMRTAHRPSTPSVPRPAPAVPASQRKLEITVPITVKAFCEETGVKVSLVIRKLMEQGAIVTINHVIDEAMVVLLAAEFKRDVTVVKQKTAEDHAQDIVEKKDDLKDLVTRAPVVTFMGHVDHGKTTLLDCIRNTKVASKESGGITQHIGASKVATKDGKYVIFLDTPGHEAFTAMRARGAKATDVVVIVVDSADGVMPQTEEAIAHAKAANVKIVVALNKIDKPGSNPNKVKGQLAAIGLQPQDWGGTTEAVEVSGLTGQGVDSLLEILALESEMLELKANPKRSAAGVVLEARKTDDRGVVATILVQNGTLRKGDVILAGKGYGRARSMMDDKGRQLTEAGPSTPVEVTGLVQVPDAGDVFQVVPEYSHAKEVAEERNRKAREAQLNERQHVSLENLFLKISADKLKEVRVILKVDVTGSLEVLKEALRGLSADEVKLKVLHAACGGITEGDILLADASDALVIGFHVDVEGRAADLAKDRGVEIKIYTVIYQAIEEMKAALEGLLEPELVEVKQGHATVKEVFRISKVGAIAGCMVSDGKILRNSQVRVIRDQKVVHTGKIDTLKRFKDDAKEVAEGYECGIKVEKHDDIRKGDVLEAFEIQKVARKLEKKK